MNYLIKTGVFSLVCNYLRPSNNSRQLIFNIKAVVLLKFTKMVKYLPEFEYFNCILEKIDKLFLKLEDQKLKTMQL